MERKREEVGNNFWHVIFLMNNVHRATHPLQHRQCRGHRRRKADEDRVSPLHVQCSVAEFVSCHMSTECLLTTQQGHT